MNWIVILSISLIIFICLINFIYLINEKNPINLLYKNIKTLSNCVNFKIFKKQLDIIYGGQINFELTKNRLMKKYNLVSKTICNMINLYYADDKISNYYNEQIAKFSILLSEVENELDELSQVENNNNDFALNQYGKVIFDKLNNKLNNQISAFLVGNAKFYTKLKFHKDGKKSITIEEFNKKQKVKKIILYIISLIISIGISILTNLLCKFIGI